MRIHLHLSENTEPVPFHYQQTLVGAFHKWLGENELHDGLSLYSLSWLSHGEKRRNALDFPRGSTFCISAPDPGLLQSLIQGVFKGQDIRWGMRVREVVIQPTPDFGSHFRFFAQSPILIKRMGEKHQRYYYHDDPESDDFMTDTLRQKLSKAGLTEEIKVGFDRTYQNPKIKLIRYHDLDIKGTLCPVLVSGDPRAVQFAWEVGVGNSTGIGFGCLK